MEQYKGILVFAEQRNGIVQNVAFELLGKARDLADSINEQVTAVLLGKGVEPLSEQLIHAGADRVLVVDHDLLKDYITEPYAEAICHIVHTYKPEVGYLEDRCKLIFINGNDVLTLLHTSQVLDSS